MKDKCEKGPLLCPRSDCKRLAYGMSTKVETDLGEANRCWFYLRGEPRDFVDHRSVNDIYPARLWDELRDFSATPDCAEGLGRSRYDAATVICKKVPAAAQYTLGEVCHIVQLSIKVHRIFGYRDGGIVPYGESSDCADDFVSAVNSFLYGHEDDEQVPYREAAPQRHLTEQASVS